MLARLTKCFVHLTHFFVWLSVLLLWFPTVLKRSQNLFALLLIQFSRLSPMLLEDFLKCLTNPQRLNLLALISDFGLLQTYQYECWLDSESLERDLQLASLASSGFIGDFVLDILSEPSYDLSHFSDSNGLHAVMQYNLFD